MKTTKRTIGWLLASIGLILLSGCSGGAPPDGECAADGEGCTAISDCCGALECIDGTCGTAPQGTQAAIPAKRIGLDLTGIHDPESDAYNSNCIGCHGDRTDEVALDGTSPSAHSTMLELFGSGNDRCIACHSSGPDFLTQSAVALREQTEITDCARCHDANAVFAFYAQ